MWTLSKLEIDGLMSFDSAKIDFSAGGVHVIYGKNLDIGSDKSNGSGKSAIIEGIGFGITGSPLRKVSIKDLVNDDKKSAIVIIELNNVGLNETMTIERLLFRSKSSVAKVFINGEEISNLTSTDEANKFIMEKMGVSKEDLLNFFVLMASKFTPFLDSSDTKKKEVINRFSNGVIVDKAIDEITIDLDLCQDELVPEQEKLGKLSATLEALESTLEDALSVSNDTINIKEEKIKINNELECRLREESDRKTELKVLGDNLLKTESKLKDIPDSSKLERQLQELKKELDEKTVDRNNIRDLVDDLKHKRKHIDFQINGVISCPSCKHEFDPSDGEFSINEAKVLRNELIRKINKTIEKGKKVRSEMDKISESVSSFGSRIRKIKDMRRYVEDETSSIKSNIASTERSLMKDIATIESINIKLRALDSSKPVDTITPLRERIESTKEKLIPVQDKIQDLSEEKDEYIEQIDYFKRFKSYLANLSLKSMESLVNDFLDDFGSDIFLELNGEKKLGSGKMKEKIDATLVRNGTDIGSFPKRSGGEKASINLAFAKTLSHLINLNAGEGRGLDLLIIDEILDSMDAEGLTSVVRSFEKNNESVILISHIPLPDSVGNHITVCKENDVSRIIEKDGE